MTPDLLVFCPCCESKKGWGIISAARQSLDLSSLSEARNAMITRNDLKIDFQGSLTSALRLYTGAFYGPLEKESIIDKIRNGSVALIVISAGYGLVDAFEPIHKYDAEMKGSVATQWKNHGLVEIISSVCLGLNPNRVLGFFQANRAGHPQIRNTGISIQMASVKPLPLVSILKWPVVSIG